MYNKLKWVLGSFSSNKTNKSDLKTDLNVKITKNTAVSSFFPSTTFIVHHT